MHGEGNSSAPDLRKCGVRKDVRFRRAVDSAMEKANGATGMAYCLLEPNNRFYILLFKSMKEIAPFRLKEGEYLPLDPKPAYSPFPASS